MKIVEVNSATRKRPRVRGSLHAVLALLAIAASAPVACSPRPQAAVVITSPADGDTVRGTSVTITLSARGVTIAPAAEGRPGTAHHHLYFDSDMTPEGEPIPQGVSGIVHLGTGDSTYVWKNVAPGTHRIIAVLADPAHVPLRPLAADTVHIVVVQP
ncbi:MAG TPA: DUF4399 domain-containing protein [Gemmatimonadaceae bacterium]|nr:DUF4399 domain-containing protein [Gemmatimonadaceae bacterium]